MPTMTLSNKLIAVLLSFALVFSFTPNIAFADNETNSQVTAEEAGSDENNTKENTTDSSLADGIDPSDSSVSSQNNSTSSFSTSASDSDEQINSNARTSSSDNDQANAEAVNTEANDQANSWRYIDGEQIYSYEGATTEAVDPNTPMPFAAAPDAFSYATWYKSNGTSSYTYKETPSSSGQNISVSGVKRVGIDVSYHNGTIDWAKVKNSGVSFAIIRCGYGSDFRNQDDTQFINNVRGAQANGIDIGIYLYSYAMNTTGNDSSATSEAEHVLRLLNEAGLEPSDLAYPIFYDLEESKQLALGSKKLGELATTFCNVISNAGYEVGIYSNLNWWTNYLTDSAFDNSSWHKWAARYPGQNKATDSGVSGTEIWQFSDCGNVDGINGNCDMNFDYVGPCSSPLVQDSKGLRFLNEDGSYFCNGWKTVSGKTYFFGDDSYALQWGHEIDGEFYYFDADFSMYTGWLTWKSDGTKSYFGSDGAALTGWQTIDGKRYYFDAENYCHSYLWGHEIDDKFYYFDADGSMYTGLLTWKSDGTKSYFGSDGVMTSGWQTWQGERYYIDPSTMRAVKWTQVIEGKTYYFDEDCSMYTGWLKWKNSDLFSYYGSDGVMATGLWIIDGAKYDFGSSGKIKIDTVRVNMCSKAQQYFSSTSYLILVDRSNHKVGVFRGSLDNWSLVYYWSCTTGAPNTPTITGSYYTTGFKRASLSTDSRAITCTQIWGGYFFHSILASESELGKSLSHGCIRLPYSAAAWVYNNIHLGTRVIIYN